MCEWLCDDIINKWNERKKRNEAIWCVVTEWKRKSLRWQCLNRACWPEDRPPLATEHWSEHTTHLCCIKNEFHLFCRVWRINLIYVDNGLWNTKRKMPYRIEIINRPTDRPHLLWTLLPPASGARALQYVHIFPISSFIIISSENLLMERLDTIDSESTCVLQVFQYPESSSNGAHLIRWFVVY